MRSHSVEKEILPYSLFPRSENIKHHAHTTIELKLTAELLAKYVFFTPSLPMSALDDMSYFHPDRVTGKNHLTITNVNNNQKMVDMRLCEELIKIISLSEHHFATVSTSAIQVWSIETFSVAFQYDFTYDSNRMLIGILNECRYPNKVLTVALLKHIQKLQLGQLNRTLETMPAELNNVITEFNHTPESIISGEFLQEGELTHIKPYPNR